MQLVDALLINSLLLLSLLLLSLLDFRHVSLPTILLTQGSNRISDKPYKHCFELLCIQHPPCINTMVLLPQLFFTPINHYSSKSWGNNKHSCFKLDRLIRILDQNCISLNALFLYSWGRGGGYMRTFLLLTGYKTLLKRIPLFWREAILLTGASLVELSKRAGKTHFSRLSLFQKKKFWTDAWSINRHYDNWFIQIFEVR